MDAARKVAVSIAAAANTSMYPWNGWPATERSPTANVNTSSVTMATVGFGDIVPITPFGRFLTSILVLIGYSVIAVPTGIYTAELASTLRPKRRSVRCQECGLIDHEADAWHCRRCGRCLPEDG